MLRELKAPAQDCPGGQQQSQESGLLLGAQGLITLGDVSRSCTRPLCL